MVSLERNGGILTLKSLYVFHEAMTLVCSSGGFSPPRSQEMAGGVESDEALCLRVTPRVSAASESFMKCVWRMKPGKGGQHLF